MNGPNDRSFLIGRRIDGGAKGQTVCSRGLPQHPVLTFFSPFALDDLGVLLNLLHERPHKKVGPSARDARWAQGTRELSGKVWGG